ncbi:cysteine--tRNA ligase [Enterobacter sp. ECC-019]|uniref:cysteine--tRNA ligase n=1 Tax=Enterobacter sp. ECC-019 TaxID=3116478 RepID=UPI00375426EE
MLSIYNTLTKTKEIFKPRIPGKVNMYVCGMTVYDHCHIGHARMLLSFDLVVRWLRVIGYNVTYVRNITDIDDKIIKRSLMSGETITDVTHRYIESMNEDSLALGIVRPDFEPRATMFINEMIEMIVTLIGNGLAYPAANGDVYFSVRKFPDYGKLSGKSIDELCAGTRITVDPFKKDPLDFVLWKAAKSGEPSWPSPWGKGRPGWHIECSAMSTHYFGSQFDIHGGGADLEFPHHENEIAQSEGAHNCSSVNYWMHNGFVRVNDEKMSKSLDNFFTIRDVLKHYDPEVIRFFILRAHYRSPINYSDKNLDDARQSLTRLYLAMSQVQSISDAPCDDNDPYVQRFWDAMNDDLNTPDAMAVLFELAAEINKTHSPHLAGKLRKLANLLGFLERDPREFLQGNVSDNECEEILSIINARQAARVAKQFAEADRLRDLLSQKGIVLEDTITGTTWRQERGG